MVSKYHGFKDKINQNIDVNQMKIMNNLTTLKQMQDNKPVKLPPNSQYYS